MKQFCPPDDVMAYTLTFNTQLTGVTKATFNAAAYKSSLVEFLGNLVRNDDISLTCDGGSCDTRRRLLSGRAVATVLVVEASLQVSQTNTLTSIQDRLNSPAAATHLTNALGVPVTSSGASSSTVSFPPPPPASSTGLSTGAVIGIAIGVTAGGLCLIGLIIMLIMNGANRRKDMSVRMIESVKGKPRLPKEALPSTNPPPYGQAGAIVLEDKKMSGGI
jgi:hypothetical protein